jgi:hypothetical protein
MQQGTDNEARKQAEEQIKSLRSTQAKVLLSSFCEIIFTPAQTEQDSNLKPLACLLLKKFYLDERPEEKDFEQITADEIS